MPITERQRQLRRTCVGASDVPAVLGVDAFRSAYDVWLSKTRDLSYRPTTAAELGNLLEPAVLDFAERELGQLDRDILVEADGLNLAANLDARIVDTDEPVDAKTSGLLSGRPFGEWGDEYTDRVPPYVIVQVTAQMLCTGAEAGYVAALLAGRGFVLYRIARDESLVAEIAEAVTTFWASVEAGTPPSDALPSLETARRLPRTAGKTTTIKPDTLTAFVDARAAVRAAIEAREVAEARVLIAIDDAEEATDGTGRRLTCFRQSRRAHKVPASTYRKIFVGKDKRLLASPPPLEAAR